KYVDAAAGAVENGIRFEAVQSFHAHPRLLAAFAERVHSAAPREEETIVFTAHSLPLRVIEAGDPYPDEGAATARGVAREANIGGFRVDYQSAGRTPEPWVGADLGQTIENCANEGARQFLIVPIGFVCDHTEILFDIDVQAVQTARRFGASLRRTKSLNTSP